MLIIIIPTWQAETALPRLLTQLAGERVIVADGGSTDLTVKRAVQGGAVLALGASGRGAQLRLGAQHAALSGSDKDWFLFLHADSQLPDGWRAVVAQAMDERAEKAARYFRFRADANGLRARLMDGLVGLRSRVLGLPYGDQGLLISGRLYQQVGGYRPMPLFEDVDMVERVRALAPLRPLPAPLTTDVSKHWRDGVWRRGLRNLRILWRYKRGANPEALLRDYGS